MDRIPVTSSLITAAGHDEATHVLEVELATGPVYRYFAVPRRVFEGLMAAESPGAFFNGKIRDTYPYQRLPDM